MPFCIDCRHLRRGGECADGEDATLLDYVTGAPRKRRSVCVNKNENGKCTAFEAVSGGRALARRVAHELKVGR